MNLSCVLTWCHADDFLETICHMALTVESNCQGNLSERFTDLDKSLRIANTHTFQISMRRHAYLGAKGTQKVVGTQGNMLGQQVKADTLCKIFFNEESG